MGHDSRFGGRAHDGMFPRGQGNAGGIEEIAPRPKIQDFFPRCGCDGLLPGLRAGAPGGCEKDGDCQKPFQVTHPVSFPARCTSRGKVLLHPILMHTTPAAMSTAPKIRMRPKRSWNRRIPPTTPATALTWRTEEA
jgi:hypothetical protein